MRITPLLLIIALIIGGCSLWQASGPETGSARADETAREKRARVAACMDRETALAMRDTMVVDQCDDRTLIVCFNERDLTVEVDGKPVRVECEDSNVVDVDFGDDDRRWRAVAWSGMRIANVLPRRKTAPRPPAPTPKPAPRPPAPRPPAPRPDPAPRRPAPAPDPEPDYSGYTGPRCYAPGGQTWRPC